MQEMDLLTQFIVAVSAFFALLVIALIVLSGVVTLKYHRQNPDALGADRHGSLTLALVWSVIPFVLAIALFGWSAAMLFRK